jgi:WD40 repeat protein
MIRVWRVGTETTTGKVVRLAEPVWRLALSPDGRRIAGVIGGQRVDVFDTADYRLIARLRHSDDVRALAFDPEGKQLATYSSAGIIVWDIGNGKEVVRFVSSQDVEGLLAFRTDADGRSRLITVRTSPPFDGDNATHVNALLWRPEDMIEEVCERLTTRLTKEEWLLYGVDNPTACDDYK